MNNDPMDAFETAVRLGPLALLRLRAEYLLDRAKEGMPLSDDERATLERITVAPAETDRQFLAGFDDRIAEEPDQ